MEPEQRVMTRYTLQVPAHVETISDDENIQLFEWQTRDISSSGAFILTNGQLLEHGTNIKVNLRLNTFAGSGSWVVMNGRVVRTESEGIGVCFDEQYQFVSETPTIEM